MGEPSTDVASGTRKRVAAVEERGPSRPAQVLGAQYQRRRPSSADCRPGDPGDYNAYPDFPHDFQEDRERSPSNVISAWGLLLWADSPPLHPFLHVPTSPEVLAPRVRTSETSAAMGTDSVGVDLPRAQIL